MLLDGNGYYNEIEEMLRIAKYVKSRNVSQLPEAIRKIIQARQSEAHGARKNRRNAAQRSHRQGRVLRARENG